MNVYFANVNGHEFIGLFTELLRLTFTIEVHTIDYKVNTLIIVFVEAKFIRSRKYKAYKCQKRAKIVTIEINVIKFLHTTGLGDDRAMGCLK